MTNYHERWTSGGDRKSRQYTKAIYKVWAADQVHKVDEWPEEHDPSALPAAPSTSPAPPSTLPAPPDLADQKHRPTSSKSPRLGPERDIKEDSPGRQEKMKAKTGVNKDGTQDNVRQENWWIKERLGPRKPATI